MKERLLCPKPAIAVLEEWLLCPKSTPVVPVELLLCPKSMIVVPEERRLWCLRIGFFVLSLLAWFLRTSQEWLCS